MEIGKSTSSTISNSLGGTSVSTRTKLNEDICVDLTLNYLVWTKIQVVIIGAVLRFNFDATTKTLEKNTNHEHR